MREANADCTGKVKKVMPRRTITHLSTLCQNSKHEIAGVNVYVTTKSTKYTSDPCAIYNGELKYK